jgi:hypothetical protein
MKTKCCDTRRFLVLDHRTVCMNESCNHYLTETKIGREYDKARKALSVSLFTFCLLFSFEDSSKALFPAKPLELKYLDADISELTLDDVKREINLQKVLCEEEVIAQARLESANLKSYLFIKTNNMFGMRYPAKRPTTAAGMYLPAKDTIIYGEQKELRRHAAQNNYAVYDHWRDAVADYKLWQQHNFKVQERYTEFLGRVYAEDSLYVSKIRRMSRQTGI